jgi:hypothetical protein
MGLAVHSAVTDDVMQQSKVSQDVVNPDYATPS